MNTDQLERAAVLQLNTTRNDLFFCSACFQFCEAVHSLPNLFPHPFRILFSISSHSTRKEGNADQINFERDQRTKTKGWEIFHNTSLPTIYFKIRSLWSRSGSSRKYFSFKTLTPSASFPARSVDRGKSKKNHNFKMFFRNFFFIQWTNMVQFWAWPLKYAA